MSSANCEDEPRSSYYLEYAISLPLFIILQTLLLGKTLYHEYTFTNQNAKISIISRILNIILQILGSLYLIMELFRFVIDPHTDIIRGQLECSVFGYSSKVIPFLFYGVFLFIILFRLNVTFGGTPVALKPSVLYTSIALIFILTIAISIPIIIINGRSTCIIPWNTPDFKSFSNNNNVIFATCTLPLNSKAAALIAISVMFIVICNIVFGAIFMVKMKTLLSVNDNKDDIDFEVKAIMIKNCILTLTGAVSTLIAFTFWLSDALPIDRCFSFSDIFINCLVIVLMLKYNERYYKKLCKPCIMICFIKYDKTKAKMARNGILMYIDGVASNPPRASLELKSVHSHSNKDVTIKPTS